MNQEKVYSRKEVQEIIEPLLKQIEFFNIHTIKLKEWIRIPWFKKVPKSVFLRQVRIAEDESDTIIFNLLKLTPEQFAFYKDWYDKQSPKNN